jgi:NAD(P)-dependent dehydrogenase (short-subunit alcohol dehydrogenase family)
LGIDRHDADIVADLSLAEGRAQAVETVQRSEGLLGGVVACAGLGIPGPDPAAIVSVNFFGVCEVLEGVRPLLALGEAPRAVVIVSNAAAVIPNLPTGFVDAMLERDETLARELAKKEGDLMAYACSKLAIARWLRRTSVTAGWAGSGIRLNGIAPGATSTPMLAASLQDARMSAMGAQMPVPAGRIGEADEIAALAEVLLSPVAELLVGQLIYHDGGTEAAVRGEDWP